ncbi:hypothetical protein V8E53_006896 [Lactarius tabidus]
MATSTVVDIRNTYGAVFVGLLVNMILLGLEIAQAWSYYWQYWHKDKKAFKLFVAFLILMDSTSTLMCALTIYWHLVLNFGNLESLASSVWFMNAAPLFSTIPICSVQLYYARRAYLTSQSLICPIIVVPLIFGSTFFGLYFSIKTLIVGTPVHAATWLTCISMGANVFGDIMITATICWSLYRKRTGFARTDSMIITLMVNTINSAFLLSTIGTAMLICYAVAPNNLIWLAFVWVLSKCFMNSLLAMLNTRDYVRNRSTTDNQESAYNLSSIRLEQSKSQSGQPGVAVTVHRSTTSDFAETKSGHVTGPRTLEDPKPV